MSESPQSELMDVPLEIHRSEIMDAPLEIHNNNVVIASSNEVNSVSCILAGFSMCMCILSIVSIIYSKLLCYECIVIFVLVGSYWIQFLFFHVPRWLIYRVDAQGSLFRNNFRKIMLLSLIAPLQLYISPIILTMIILYTDISHSVIIVVKLCFCGFSLTIILLYAYLFIEIYSQSVIMRN